MINRNYKKKYDFTPEKTQAWSLALYPAVILILVVFMVLTNRQVTTDIITLFIGLVTAGSLHAAIQKKGGDYGSSNHDIRVNDPFHSSRNQELEPNDWRRPNNSDYWNDRHIHACTY